ncbi:MAG: hypothetical protein K2K98_13600, partial [Muribaculaceae bacterium]|nr:hypothetical protein [Muribaculaceae bacterium]
MKELQTKEKYSKESKLPLILQMMKVAIISGLSISLFIVALGFFYFVSEDSPFDIIKILNISVNTFTVSYFYCLMIVIIQYPPLLNGCHIFQVGIKP